MVPQTATRGFDFRRTSRNRAQTVPERKRMVNPTPACNPPSALSFANSTSDSHSHAYQGAPGFEKEKMSRTGTHPLAIIHSPVRMCQPVSQSLSSVFTPSMRPKTYAMGMRKAKSASEGRNLTANWERDSISLLLQAIQELATGRIASNARVRSWNDRKSM